MQFSDLRIPLATRMQMEVIGSDYKAQALLGQLLGYRVGTCLLVQLAKKPTTTLQRNTRVSVRVGLQSAIIQFDSLIEYICEAPFLYVHLAYPGAVTIEQQLRRNPRFELDAPVSATSSADSQVSTGRILDISLNGARVQLEQELTTPEITLSVAIFAVGSQHQLSLKATVKRISSSLAEAPNTFLYGASFIDVPASQKLLLQALCYELQAEANV